MVPPTPTPSARLVRAAAAERADVARHRERLQGARERLLAEVAGIDAALRELDERDVLLDRLAGSPVGDARTARSEGLGSPDAPHEPAKEAPVALADRLGAGRGAAATAS